MKVVAVVSMFLMGLASPVLAANANQPYQNVDHSNDAGNNTGDSKVDALNRGQLDQNQGVTNPSLGQAPAQVAPAPQR